MLETVCEVREVKRCEEVLVEEVVPECREVERQECRLKYPCTDISNRLSYRYFAAFWWTLLLTSASPVLMSSITYPDIVSDLNCSKHSPA